ncbi:MAG: S9 family peptidase [Pseudomonadota bacterium]
MKKRLMTLPLMGAAAIALAGCATTTDSAKSAAGSALQAASSAVTASPAPTYPVEAFFETTSYSLAGSERAWFPDNRSVLISSDETGIFNAYALDVETGARRALTTSTTNASFAIGVLKDASILYTADQGGNEINHLYHRATDGTVTDLTPGDAVKASFISWLAGNDAFIISTNERDPSYFDAYKVDANTFEKTRIFENTQGLGNFVISHDGRLLAGLKERTSADNTIFLVDLAGDGTVQEITPHEGNIQHTVFTFTPDGSSLVYGTDAAGEFVQAWKHDVTTGAQEAMLEAEWDVSYVTYSPSGQYLIAGVNEDARTLVSIVDDAGAFVSLPDGLPDGDLRNLRFAPEEDALALIVNSSRSPSDIFHVDVAKGEVKQLTDALGGKIDPSDLVEAEVIRYPSYDGLDIPSIQYKPLGASATNPVPAIVLVHGGPGGQSRTGYSAMIQHLVNNGYAVLAANNRGSSGYGKTFFHLDDKRHGDVDLRDIVEAKSYLADLDWVDADNIAVMGGSYGGYMTMAALAFHPEVFDAGVNIFGVTNWVRTLVSIPPWWESFKEALYDEMGDPATDGNRHRAISPLFHAENIVKPVLVVQGANDPRVLQVESDEMVAAIEANGVPVEYILFPDEGHGFRKRENRITASKGYVKFLDRWLKGQQETAAGERGADSGAR